MKSIEEQFDDWLDEKLLTAFIQPGPDYENAKKWAKHGWDGAIQEIGKEGMRSHIKSLVEQLETLYSLYPELFQEILAEKEG